MIATTARRILIAAALLAAPLGLAACGSGRVERPSFDERFVNTLIDQLGSEDWNSRYHAAQALGCMKPRPYGAVAALECSLCDDDARVRSMAAWAIEQIESGLPPMTLSRRGPGNLQ